MTFYCQNESGFKSELLTPGVLTQWHTHCLILDVNQFLKSKQGGNYDTHQIERKPFEFVPDVVR